MSAADRQIISKVKSIEGEVIAIALDGSKRVLMVGDFIYSDEVIDTSNGKIFLAQDGDVVLQKDIAAIFAQEELSPEEKSNIDKILKELEGQESSLFAKVSKDKLAALVSAEAGQDKHEAPVIVPHEGEDFGVRSQAQVFISFEPLPLQPNDFFTQPIIRIPEAAVSVPNEAIPIELRATTLNQGESARESFGVLGENNTIVKQDIRGSYDILMQSHPDAVLAVTVTGSLADYNAAGLELPTPIILPFGMGMKPWTVIAGDAPNTVSFLYRKADLNLLNTVNSDSKKTLIDFADKHIQLIHDLQDTIEEQISGISSLSLDQFEIKANLNAKFGIFEALRVQLQQEIGLLSSQEKIAERNLATWGTTSHNFGITINNGNNISNNGAILELEANWKILGGTPETMPSALEGLYANRAVYEHDANLLAVELSAKQSMLTAVMNDLIVPVLNLSSFNPVGDADYKQVLSKASDELTLLEVMAQGYKHALINSLEGFNLVLRTGLTNDADFGFKTEVLLVNNTSTSTVIPIKIAELFTQNGGLVNVDALASGLKVNFKGDLTSDQSLTVKTVKSELDVLNTQIELHLKLSFANPSADENIHIEIPGIPGLNWQAVTLPVNSGWTLNPSNNSLSLDLNASTHGASPRLSINDTLTLKFPTALLKNIDLNQVVFKVVVDSQVVPTGDNEADLSNNTLHQEFGFDVIGKLPARGIYMVESVSQTDALEHDQKHASINIKPLLENIAVYLNLLSGAAETNFLNNTKIEFKFFNVDSAEPPKVLLSDGAVDPRIDFVKVGDSWILTGAALGAYVGAWQTATSSTAAAEAAARADAARAEADTAADAAADAADLAAHTAADAAARAADLAAANYSDPSYFVLYDAAMNAAQSAEYAADAAEFAANVAAEFAAAAVVAAAAAESAAAALVADIVKFENPYIIAAPYGADDMSVTVFGIINGANQVVVQPLVPLVIDAVAQGITGGGFADFEIKSQSQASTSNEITFDLKVNVTSANGDGTENKLIDINLTAKFGQYLPPEGWSAIVSNNSEWSIKTVGTNVHLIGNLIDKPGVFESDLILKFLPDSDFLNQIKTEIEAASNSEPGSGSISYGDVVLSEGVYKIVITFQETSDTTRDIVKIDLTNIFGDQLPVGFDPGWDVDFTNEGSQTNYGFLTENDSWSIQKEDGKTYLYGYGLDQEIIQDGTKPVTFDSTITLSFNQQAFDYFKTQNTLNFADLTKAVEAVNEPIVSAGNFNNVDLSNVHFSSDHTIFDLKVNLLGADTDGSEARLIDINLSNVFRFDPARSVPDGLDLDWTVFSNNSIWRIEIINGEVHLLGNLQGVPGTTSSQLELGFNSAFLQYLPKNDNGKYEIIIGGPRFNEPGTNPADVSSKEILGPNEQDFNLSNDTAGPTYLAAGTSVEVPAATVLLKEAQVGVEELTPGLDAFRIDISQALEFYINKNKDIEAFIKVANAQIKLSDFYVNTSVETAITLLKNGLLPEFKIGGADLYNKILAYTAATTPAEKAAIASILYHEGQYNSGSSVIKVNYSVRFGTYDEYTILPPTTVIFDAVGSGTEVPVFTPNGYYTPGPFSTSSVLGLDFNVLVRDITRHSQDSNNEIVVVTIQLPHAPDASVLIENAPAGLGFSWKLDPSSSGVNSPWTLNGDTLTGTFDLANLAILKTLNLASTLGLAFNNIFLQYLNPDIAGNNIIDLTYTIHSTELSSPNDYITSNDQSPDITGAFKVILAPNENVMDSKSVIGSFPEIFLGNLPDVPNDDMNLGDAAFDFNAANTARMSTMLHVAINFPNPNPALTRTVAVFLPKTGDKNSADAQQKFLDFKLLPGAENGWSIDTSYNSSTEIKLVKTYPGDLDPKTEATGNIDDYVPVSFLLTAVGSFDQRTLTSSGPSPIVPQEMGLHIQVSTSAVVDIGGGQTAIQVSSSPVIATSQDIIVPPFVMTDERAPTFSSGNDYYYIENPGEGLSGTDGLGIGHVFNPWEGNDTVIGSHGRDVFNSGQNSFVLTATGGVAINTESTITFGNEVFVGGLGRDWIESGAGNDVAYSDGTPLVVSLPVDIGPAYAPVFLTTGLIDSAGRIWGIFLPKITDVIATGAGDDVIYTGGANYDSYISAYPGNTVSNVPEQFLGGVDDGVSDKSAGVLVFAGPGDNIIFSGKGADVIILDDTIGITRVVPITGSGGLTLTVSTITSNLSGLNYVYNAIDSTGKVIEHGDYNDMFNGNILKTAQSLITGKQILQSEYSSDPVVSYLYDVIRPIYDASYDPKLTYNLNGSPLTAEAINDEHGNNTLVYWKDSVSTDPNSADIVMYFDVTKDRINLTGLFNELAPNMTDAQRLSAIAWTPVTSVSPYDATAEIEGGTNVGMDGVRITVTIGSNQYQIADLANVQVADVNMHLSDIFDVNNAPVIPAGG